MKNKIISAFDAYNNATGVDNPGFSQLFWDIMNHITSSSERGDFYISHYTGGVHLDDFEFSEIQNLGYSIWWNSPCLWYEISWTNPNER